MITTWIIIGIIVVIVIWLIVMYNGLIRSRNRTKEGWSDIDVQLKRRHNLIPNLINSVKGYMAHERGLLENVTKLRSQAVQARESGNTGNMGNIESQLGGMLSKLQIAVEAYPNLKANENVAQLMDELADTENKIQAARRFYNGQVRNFNTRLQSFPTNIVASAFGFKIFDFFEIEDAKERENVTVDLNYTKK